jgi:hypothetical protein
VLYNRQSGIQENLEYSLKLMQKTFVFEVDRASWTSVRPALRKTCPFPTGSNRASIDFDGVLLWMGRILCRSACPSGVWHLSGQRFDMVLQPIRAQICDCIQQSKTLTHHVSEVDQPVVEIDRTSAQSKSLAHPTSCQRDRPNQRLVPSRWQLTDQGPKISRSAALAFHPESPPADALVAGRDFRPSVDCRRQLRKPPRAGCKCYGVSSMPVVLISSPLAQDRELLARRLLRSARQVRRFAHQSANVVGR